MKIWKALTAFTCAMMAREQADTLARAGSGTFASATT